MYAKFAKNMDDCSQPILSLILLYKPCVCTLLSFFVVELLALAVVGLGIYLNYTKDGTLPCYLAPTANAAASASKLQRVKTNSKVAFSFFAYLLLLFHKILFKKRSFHYYSACQIRTAISKLRIWIFRNFLISFISRLLFEVISMKKQSDWLKN